MIKNLFLPLNLQFFSADTGGTGGTGDTSTGTEGGTDKGTADGGSDTSWIDSLYTGDEDPDEKESETMIPKSRFDSVNSKYKELSTNSKTLSTDHETLKTTHAELEGNYKQSTERVTALEGVIQSLVDAEMESISEDFHDLIPEDKSVEQKLDWIIKAKAKGMFGMGRGSYEVEIGGMSNPGSRQGGGRNTAGMNPLQLLTMGYGK